LIVYLSEPAIEQQIVIKKQVADNSSQDVNNRQQDLFVDVSGNEFDDTDEEIYEEVITLQDDKGNEIESVVIREAYIQELLSSFRRRILHDFRGYKDEDLFSMYYDAFEDDYIQFHSKNISLALQEYETMYLPAQRIFNREQVGARSKMPRTYTYEIDHVNDEISGLYRRAQNRFAAASQRIDATYISRLIERNDFYSKEELQGKLTALKERIDGFKQLNLISNMELLEYSLDDDNSYQEYKKVMTLYVDDMNDKMDMFEVLYQKMSLYKRIVTTKVLSEKSIDFGENGLKVINVKGRELTDLHKLSSGEQNLLILYYNLIFRSSKKTILMIDEPENSLHVAWQSKMLEDYIKMSDTTGCQIILATHSPTFIDGKWGLTTDLYRQYKGKD
jgi:ABC-type dipeptide/oligopeptide/nickel transport system ATPase component